MIFISHATDDDIFVDRLAEELAIAGFRTWVDHQDMPPGSKWVTHLEKALSESEVMILVCSNTSMQSTYVTSEWHAFFDMKKMIIPIVIDDCEMPPFLRTLHLVNFRNDRRWDKNVQSVVNILTTQLGKTLDARSVKPKPSGTGYLNPAKVAVKKDANQDGDIEQMRHDVGVMLEAIAPTYRAEMLYVVVMSEEAVYEYPLYKTHIIGRSHKPSGYIPDVEIRDSEYHGLISRKHACLTMENGQLFIEDLGSVNGTYLNGVRLEPKHRYPVESFDIIQLSRYVAFSVRYTV
ncbi:MAG: TIR domain-containing protein [Chloroflexota bacterium]